MPPAPPAVLLLSGGLDSTTMLAYAIDAGFDVHAMTFRYGQRHAAEIDAARRVASRYRVRDHVVVDIDLRTFGGSALTSDIDVPKDRLESDIAQGIPITYVPARNTIFLSFCLAWSEVLGASDIFIGVNALDYSGYPDCRPEFVQLGGSLGVDYTLTLSCYDPAADGLACGHCDSCQLRRKGFDEAGVPDPTRYS